MFREEAEVVRRIFGWRAEGVSYRDIARRLSREGAKTQRGGAWQVSTLRRIVSNNFYTGLVEFDGGFVRGRHEGIIRDELFARANAAGH